MIQVENEEFYDLSLPVGRQTVSWPLGSSLFLERDYDWKKNDSLCSSTVKMSLHLGTHLNAPFHYSPDAPQLHELSLQHFFGSCEVIRLKQTSLQIEEDILDMCQFEATRLLIDTRQIAPIDGGSYPKISKNFFVRCKRENIVCVGFDAFFLWWDTDTPSEFFLPVLEGLLLSKIPIGFYKIQALPLSLLHVEASPIRVILTKNRKDLTRPK